MGRRERKQGRFFSQSPLIRSTMRVNLSTGHHKPSLCFMNLLLAKNIKDLNVGLLFSLDAFSIHLNVNLEFDGTELCILHSSNSVSL